MPKPPSPPPPAMLAPWKGPFGGVPPWDKVAPAAFPAAFERAMAAQRREIARITGNPHAAHLRQYHRGPGTLRPDARSGSAPCSKSTPAPSSWARWRASSRRSGPRLAAFADEIIQDPVLFRRIRTVYAAPGRAGLDPQQPAARLAAPTPGSCAAGPGWTAPARRRIQAINQRLAEPVHPLQPERPGGGDPPVHRHRAGGGPGRAARRRSVTRPPGPRRPGACPAGG